MSMAGNVSMINGHIDPIEKADCSKCARTDCTKREHFEYEMLVKKYGCHRFKSRSEQK